MFIIEMSLSSHKNKTEVVFEGVVLIDSNEFRCGGFNGFCILQTGLLRLARLNVKVRWIKTALKQQID